MHEQIIRASYDDNTITVYQAFNRAIATAVISNQSFAVPQFKKERMTWIKPSFLWMMYRSGWGTKENQECILAVQIKREGLEWALQNSCLSHFDNALYPSYDAWRETLDKAPVRIQWDPEKNIFLQPLDYRSIQIGLSGAAVERYVNDWVVSVQDITARCKTIHKLIQDEKIDEARSSLPIEQIYPLPQDMAVKINSFQQ